MNAINIDVNWKCKMECIHSLALKSLFNVPNIYPEANGLRDRNTCDIIYDMNGSNVICPIYKKNKCLTVLNDRG